MRSNKYLWVTLGLLAGISALAYLPLIHKLGYFNDDWYLMYDVRVHGAQFFHDIFSSDRPGRAYLMIPMYSLFGLNPLPYNVSAYVFRLLGGISFFWVLQLLWPERKSFALIAALLFTIYPGFLSQHNAIDYQSHMVALFFAILSISLTLKAILSVRVQVKVGWAALSIISGWIALSQMEYYIGIEAFRLACIVVLTWRSKGPEFRRKVQVSFFNWLPFAIVPAGFLFWRIFLFEAERKATDIGSQLGQLFTSPLTGLWWLTYLFQDFFNVLLTPWVLPWSIFVLPMRLQNQLIGFGLAGVAVLLFVLGSRLVEEQDPETLAGSGPRETREQMWVGVIAILGGLAPVIAANRHIILPDYSRYTLIASIGAVILLSAFIQQLSSIRLRNVIVGLLIVIGVLTHYGNSVKAAADTEGVQNFWWQVAWRAPQFESGTTISVTYPNVAIQEDYFMWGAAGHIYYPGPKNKDDLQIQLPAIVLNEYSVSRILSKRGEDTYIKRGGVEVVNEYDRVLVMTQPTDNSCVRILDGDSPDLSLHDQNRVMLVAPYSKLDSVVTDGNSPNPPTVIFGDEPLHDWCYFYQKADLARQRGAWDEVIALYETANQMGYRPNDQIELMPFLQAYAYKGNQKMVKEFSTRINTDVFYAEQACHKLSRMDEFGYPLTSEMQGLINELFCK